MVLRGVTWAAPFTFTPALDNKSTRASSFRPHLDPAWWVTLLVGVFGVFYFFICACLVWDDLKAGARPVSYTHLTLPTKA